MLRAAIASPIRRRTLPWPPRWFRGWRTSRCHLARPGSARFRWRARCGPWPTPASACARRASSALLTPMRPSKAVRTCPACGDTPYRCSRASLTASWARPRPRPFRPDSAPLVLRTAGPHGSLGPLRDPRQMTGFDIGVLVLVAMGAVTGLMRGFVQEVLTLLAWVISLVAIHYAHSSVTHMLEGYMGNHFGAAGVLAFALLLLIPYAVV